MTRTFLVTINLTDTTDLVLIADEMMDDLSATFDVESVKPWDSPGLTTGAAGPVNLFSPEEPALPEQPN